MGKNVVDSIQLPDRKGKILLGLSLHGQSTGCNPTENSDIVSLDIEIIHEPCAPTKMIITRISDSEWSAGCSCCGLWLQVQAKEPLTWKLFKKAISQKSARR